MENINEIIEVIKEFMGEYNISISEINKDCVKQALEDLRQNGYDEGYDEGYQIGYDSGYDFGCTPID